MRSLAARGELKGDAPAPDGLGADRVKWDWTSSGPVVRTRRADRTQRKDAMYVATALASASLSCRFGM